MLKLSHIEPQDPEPATKRCRVCGENLPLKAYGRPEREATCRMCKNEKQRERYHATRGVERSYVYEIIQQKKREQTAVKVDRKFREAMAGRKFS